MQLLEVSGAVRPIYGSLGVKRLMLFSKFWNTFPKFVWGPLARESPCSSLHSSKCRRGDCSDHSFLGFETAFSWKHPQSSLIQVTSSLLETSYFNTVDGGRILPRNTFTPQHWLSRPRTLQYEESLIVACLQTLSVA